MLPSPLTCDRFTSKAYWERDAYIPFAVLSVDVGSRFFYYDIIKSYSACLNTYFELGDPLATNSRLLRTLARYTYYIISNSRLLYNSDYYEIFLITNYRLIQTIIYYGISLGI